MASSSNTNNEFRLLPAPMSFTEGNVSENWRRFKQKLDFYFNALAGTKPADKKKIGILMTTLGDAGLDVFNTFTTVDERSSYREIIDAFDEYCTPRKNTVYERFLFSQLAQGTKSVDAFIVDLKSQARRCEFAKEEFDNLIRDRLVVGIADTKVRKEMLKDPELTLETAITLAKVWARSEAEATEMSKVVGPAQNQVEIDRLQHSNCNDRNVTRYDGRERPRNRVRVPPDPRKCPNCGYDHRNNTCPAVGKECLNCNVKGHFAGVCRKKNTAGANVATMALAHEQDADNRRSNDSPAAADALSVLRLYSVVTSGTSTAWYTILHVYGVPVQFKVDSGAECNTILERDYRRLSPQPALSRPSAALRPYGADALIMPIGEFVVEIEHNTHRCQVKLFVVNFPADRPAENILGLPTIDQLGLIRKTFAVDAPAPKFEGKQSMLLAFPDVFDDGLGDVPGLVSLKTKPNTVPVVEKPRRFPFSMKQPLCDALKKLHNFGIIEPVNEPTEWVSNLLAVTKPDGSLRVCLDPKHLNDALLVPKCEIPRSDDILVDFHEKKCFTVLDLKDGFYHMTLDEASSYLTTFHSPLGRFRWKRLVMGISSAPEIFMNKMRELFGDIDGVYPYFDDLIVAGTTEEEHDRILFAVLQRARQVRVKFNHKKVQFKQPSVNYLGFQVSKEGVKPLKKHVEAIENMPRPEDRNGVMRLLGMTRYLSRFIPSLASATEALRMLTHKNVPFEWLNSHETEFEQIKATILKATSLKFYEPSAPLYIQTDSSKSGIGCCIFQAAAPIAYASRALTKTEKNYAQIEKELLAVVFSLEKFHDYCYGRHVTIYSDHKPLVAIVRKSISELTPRLQRLRLRLLRYNFELVFQPGKDLFVADTLSRAYLQTEPADESYQLVDVHASNRVEIVATPQRLAELEEATTADPDLAKLKIYLRGGWPKSKSKLSPALAKFKTFAHELEFRGKLLFFRHRLVVPSALVPLMLAALHAGHLNVNKTKQLACDTLFWLGMNQDIEFHIAACPTCNKYRRNNQPEELMPFPAPVRPWQRLHTDILTHESKNYLVIYDSYSQWIELFSLHSKTMTEIIAHFTAVFARFGVPSEIVSDNNPYNSAEWASFAEAWGFSILFSSPRYPQSNGASEKAVSIAKGVLRKNTNVPFALLQYRNAPIPHLGYSPAQLLMSRRLRTRLPVPNSKLQPELPDHAVVQQRKLQRQASQKLYHDRGTCTLPPLQVGDEIYYKKELTDTEWQPGRVTSVAENPRSYEVEDNNSQARYLRNRRFIRKPARYRDN